MLTLFATLLGLVPSVAAQGYPNKPICLMVGFSLDGMADVIVGIVAEHLRHQTRITLGRVYDLHRRQEYGVATTNIPMETEQELQ